MDQSLITRILGTLISIVVIVGLAFLFLPLAIGFLVIVFILGMISVGYIWWQSKKQRAFFEQMQAQQGQSSEETAAGYQEKMTYRRFDDGEEKIVETSDNKQWSMNDVEDIEERKRP